MYSTGADCYFSMPIFSLPALKPTFIQVATLSLLMQRKLEGIMSSSLLNPKASVHLILVNICGAAALQHSCKNPSSMELCFPQIKAVPQSLGASASCY